MRYVLSLLTAFAAAVLIVASQGGGVAYASFHCMRVHAVLGGYATNNNIQYVELRMDSPGQQFVNTHSLQFFDASNTLKATFTFPTGVTNASTGDSILIATSEFNTAVTGGASDYVFSNTNTTSANGGDPLHPVQFPGGKVYWAQGNDNCDIGFTVSPGEADSVAYGGGAADWGTAATALPMPSTKQALILNNLNQVPANNNTEYQLGAVATSTFSVAVGNLASDMSTPRNNGRTVLKLPPVMTVGGVDASIGAADGSAALTETSASSGGKGMWYAIAAAGAMLVAAGGGAGVYARRRAARAR